MHARRGEFFRALPHSPRFGYARGMPRSLPPDLRLPRPLLPLTLGSLALALVVFAAWPGLDLTVARWFYLGDGHFSGRTGLGNFARAIGYAVPFILLAPPAFLWVAEKLGLRTHFHVSGRAVAFLILTMALGPGLLVNLILKDHAHRPRPVQVQDFNGPLEFRPFYRTDGGCNINCSFVSGESSAAFWTLAPAMLAPPPVRAAAVAAAVIFGVAVSVLRMAFGGHFLSDVIFAALFTLLVIWGVGRVVYGPLRPTSPSR